MLKPLGSLVISILSLFSLGTVFAAEMPYTDVPATAPYASAVQELYDSRIISDDGSHLFRPTDLMARDFFVSLAVGIGCHACMTPSVTDIVRYPVSPFVDLPKVNQYYYCIAYAKEYNIAQGYILNEVGQSTCENSQSYTSSPFCAGNTITRIEAAAILLRRAKLWDDTLNSTNFDRSLTLPDTTSYWYGYAKKAIEINIITPKSDGKIGQDEKITRGEFAIMAARILKYTQCQSTQDKSSMPIDIMVRDTSNKIIQKTVFAQGSTDSLSTIVGTGTWDRLWTLTNTTTQEVLTGTSENYPLASLSCGRWISQVDLIDRSTRRVVSTASNTITIDCNTPISRLALDISANPLSTSVWKNINFSANIWWATGIITYRWSYGDGSTSTSSGSTNHIYRDNGAYTVTLTIIDASGNVARSSVIVIITGDRDTDSDGVIDAIDQCPLVYAQTASGCPIVSTYRPITTSSSLGSSSSSSSPLGDNICLMKKSKSQWLLIGTPNCTQCPCANTISISSPLRSCDIVFPTILSPSLDTVYSRGGFYLIP